MFCFFFALLLPSILAQNGGFCPNGWKEGPHLCWRLTEKNVKFREAIVDCLTEDPAHYGPIVNLIRVGQLRKLKNVESHRLEKKDNKVRVDAFKDQDGVWREYTDLQAVNFESFPDFDKSSGQPGQTLVYSFKTNSLHLAYDTEDEHRGLCFRQKWGVPVDKLCYRPGLENECSDRGDCNNGACVCDAGFSGAKCQIVGTRSARYEQGRDEDLKADTGCQEFVRDDGSLACYTISTTGATYHEALEACVSKGYTLAEVHGEMDQENLKTLAQPFKNAWIGLTDMDGNREFRWESGNRLEYTNWASDQSNRMMHPCVILNAVNDHKWNDIACESKSDFIGICRVY